MPLHGFLLKQGIAATGKVQTDPLVSSMLPVINANYKMLTTLLIALLAYSILVEAIPKGEQG